MAGCASSGSGGGGEDAEVIVTDSKTSGGLIEEAAPEPEPAPSPPPPPPPPPPPVAAAPTTERAADISGYSKIAEPGADAATLPAQPPRDQPPAQSGLLTAGDYDDLLNAALYRDYAREFLQTMRGNLDLPDIDVTEAYTLKVLGTDGRPVSGARVTLSVGGQTMFALKTSTAGTVRLFPEFDALPRDLTMEIKGPAGQQMELVLADITTHDNASPIQVTLREQGSATRAFDLMLVIDATGSMSDELRYLQAELSDIVGSIEAAHPGIDTRVGLIVYRDIGDEYVVRDFDFTSDIDELQAHLNAQQARGGGNYPEAMDQALETALAKSWREDSVKAVLLVADAPPRDENLGKAWDQAILARTEQIHIVPVAASGVGPKAEYMMRAMAAATQSRYIFLTDDSGVGNPHAEPDVDCYIVTRLDTMVKRVLSDLIKGERVEPSDEEIIRTVGNYNAGICELPEEGQERVQQVSGNN